MTIFPFKANKIATDRKSADSEFSLNSPAQRYESTILDLQQHPSSAYLTDVHAHCQDPLLDTEINTVIEGSALARIGRIINNGTGNDWDSVLHLQSQHSLFKSALAIHPWFIEDGWEDKLSTLDSIAKAGKIIALGECGLDRRKGSKPIDEQIKVFESHLVMAKEKGLPIIAHNVGAQDEIMHSLVNLCCKDIPVILHGFHGSMESIAFFSRCNVYFSVNARVCGSNNSRRMDMLHLLAKSGRMLLESDAPHMLPVIPDNNMKEPNLPLSLIFTIQQLQEICDMRAHEILEKTAATARGIFGI